MLRVALSSVLVFSALALGCSKPTPEPQAEEKQPVAAPAKSGAPVASTAAASAHAPNELAYDVPKAWEVMPNTSQMRKATIKVPKAAGDSEDGDLSVTSAGGSKEANIARWCNQFGLGEPTKKEERTVNGMNVTVLEIKGTYGGMGGAKKDKFMLLGAVVPGADSQLHFFKLTGPEKTVEAARKDFDTFVSSLRAK